MNSEIDNINKNIFKFYKKKNYFNSYGGEIFIAIFIFIIFIISFTYLFIKNNFKKVKKNWHSEKCNPFYMPFAGMIANEDKNVSNYDFTVKNFRSCMLNMQKDMSKYTFDPVNYMLSTIQTIWNGFTSILTSILTFFSEMISSIVTIINWCQNTLLNVTVELSTIVQKIRDTFNKSIGVIITVMYYQLVNMQFTFLWTIWTPVWSITTGLIGAVITLVEAIIALVIYIYIMLLYESFDIECGSIFLSPWACPIDAATTWSRIRMYIWIAIQEVWIALILIWGIALLALLITIIVFNNQIFSKIHVNSAPSSFPM